MMSAIEIIQTICPALADSPSLSQYVQVATESLNSRFFGKLFNQAVAYKACHSPYKEAPLLGYISQSNKSRLKRGEYPPP